MKIGILTLYYGNANYGGQLQSFAMQHILEKMGNSTEQICLIEKPLEKVEKKQVVADLLHGRIHLFRKIKSRALMKAKSYVMSKKNITNSKFADFAKRIPHTEKLYNSDTIGEVNYIYDMFVFGSDIIWNPMVNSYRQSSLTWTYFGDFTDKPKISYAASFGGENIPEEFLETAVEYLELFFAVSVRENSAKRIIESVSNLNVKAVLDPTMLVNRDEWDIYTKDFNGYGDYVFAYILGERTCSRTIAKSVAVELNVKLVTVPFVGNFNLHDLNFGDEQLSGLSVPDFLNRIKHAKCVVSDSFHAIVFSILFNVEFIALLRSAEADKGENNSRIKDLLRLFECEDRLVIDSDALKGALDTQLNFVKINLAIEENRNECMAWLRSAIAECNKL